VILLSNRAYVPLAEVKAKHLNAYTYKLTQTVFYEPTHSWQDITVKVPNYSVDRERKLVGFPRGDLEKLRTVIGDQPIVDRRTITTLPYRLQLKPHLKADDRWQEQLRLMRTWLYAGGGVVKAPPASGKSVLALAAICATQLRTLVLFEQRDLLDQWYREFMKHTTAGEIHEATGQPLVEVLRGRYRALAPICLVTFAHASTRSGSFFKLARNAFGLVVADEVHHSGSAGHRRTLLSLNPLLYLGLSATPFRKDGLERSYFDIMGPPAAESRKELLQPTVTLIPTPTMVTFSNKLPRHIMWSIILKRTHGSAERTALAVKHIAEDVAAGRVVFVPTCRKAHAQAIVDGLSEVIDPDLITYSHGGITKKGEREQIYDSVRRREKRVLIATTVIDEAVSIDTLDCLHLISPSASPREVEQRIGRIRRPMPGKLDPLVRDYVDDGCGMLKGALGIRMKVYRNIGCRIDRQAMVWGRR
jgi:superfamily II DNA or RNA helicase